MRTVFMLLLLSTIPRAASATGQCDETPTEQYPTHPDDLAAFAAGRLSLVRPDFARMYLARAYLAMSGGKLDLATQKDLIELWKRRHFAGDLPYEGAKAWLAARAAAGVKSTAELGDSGDGGSCLDDAFRMAAETSVRLSVPGALAGDERKVWMSAQDQVFSNCGGKTPSIPSALPASATLLAQAERRYQIAAAMFYAAHYADAAELFLKVAKDDTSPWASWGTYLAARAYIRNAAIVTPPNEYVPTKYREEGLKRAQTVLDAILSSGRPAERVSAARALSGFVRVRLAPLPHLREVAAVVRRGESGYVAATNDYVTALDQMLEEPTAADVPIDVHASDLPALREKDELTDWVLTLHAKTEYVDGAPRAYATEASAHALERWHAARTPAWLYAALATVDKHAASVPELLAAAAKVPRDAPAYDSVRYYALALQLADGRLARGTLIAKLDAEIAARAAQPRSSMRNALLDHRLALARGLDDALSVAVRHPIGSNDDCGLPSEVYDPKRGAEMVPRISLALEHVVERTLPLARIVLLQADAKTPVELRPRLLAMAWSRATALGALEPATQAVADQLLPALQASVRKDAGFMEPLQALLAASTPDERRFQSARVLLYSARTIDPGALDGSLTCPGVESAGGDAPLTPALSLVALSTPAERKARDRELAQLKPGGSSFDRAAAWLIEHGKAHPEDERLAQAFYDVNQISRRLRGSCQSSRWSKAAFLAMHKLFPKHALTKKVQYWY